jgi:beta-lactamase regulating signal transducer with metallopeptidase domain
MTTNETLLAQPIFQALGWALIHFLWQGALVALLYASLRVILRQRTANVRYAAACGAMLLMLALPIATTLIIKRAIPQTPALAQTPAPEAAPTWKAEATAEQLSDTQGQPTNWTASTAPAQSAITESMTLRQRLSWLLPWLVSIWLGGVLVLSLRVLGGWMMAQRLKTWKTVPATEGWQETVKRLSRRLRVSRPVRLCESAVAEVPTVIGWLRPVILVPVSAFVGLSAQQIEALLAHELAHIRRHDYLVNLLQTAVETLLFYHPAVWWVSRQIRTEREHCCDDLAVAACGNVLTYARALAELEQLRGSGGVPQLAVAADGGGSLLSRIQRLVGAPASPHQRSSAWLASLVAITTILCICVGARTAILESDANKDKSQRADASTLWKTSSDGFNFEFITGQPSGVETVETIASSQTVLQRGINESVMVVGSAPQEGEATQDDKTPVPTPIIIKPVVVPLININITPTPNAGITPKVFSFTQLPTPRPFAFSYQTPVVAVQDDDEDKPSGSYIEALTAVGYTNLCADELITMRDHGVSPAYLRELKALGYPLPTIAMAIRLTDHGVRINYIKKLAEMGYKKLSFEDLIRAADHGVRPELIEALSAAGYGNLPLEQIIRATDHGVSPMYIKQMAEVGFSGLSLDQLIRMRDHGVGPDYIKEIRSLGYTNVTADQFVSLRDHGVTAAFLRKAKERGFNNLSLDELIRLRDADIL